jgi:multiple sugar transport system permease protein
MHPRVRDERYIAWLFLLPNSLGFAVFTAGLVLFSLIVSFSNWDLQRTVPFLWIGFENYLELVRDQQFWLCFINTLYLMLGMPVAIAGSLALAILLSQKLRGIVLYRSLFYLPSITSSVALMILWKALYNPDFGPINAVVNTLSKGLGLDVQAPQCLLSTANLLGLDVEQVRITAKQFGLGTCDALITMGIWIAIGGNNMLLYLAALTNVLQELIEAAQLEGAGKWSAFRNVTGLQLAPTTFFIVVMSFIGGLQGGYRIGTFLLRQFMLTILPSLDEAAKIDGATHWQIFWDIIMPLSRAGLITLAVFTFMGNYGSFFWPLILIKSEHLRTLPNGMLYFNTNSGAGDTLRRGERIV